MADALTTTGTVSEVLKNYYDELFLQTADAVFVLKPLGRKGRIPPTEGKTVYWTRIEHLSAATTALTEATTPDAVGMSATNVTATASQYGNWVKVSDLLKLTAIDPTIEGFIKELAYNAALSIDTVIRDAVFAGGTALYASGVADRTAISETDVLTVADLRKAVRNLENAKSSPYDDGYYVGVIHPYVKYDLEGDSDWVNAHIYTSEGVKNVYNGEVGKIYNIKFVQPTTQANVLVNSGSADTDVYQTMIMGKEFFGVSDLQNLTTYVKPATSGGTSNPLELYSTIGWKAAFAVKVLNDNFAQRIESAASS